MPPVTRRDTLRLGGGALATLALPACTGAPQSYPAAPITGPLVDVHAHLFNGTDVPVTTFLTRLVLKSYDEKACTLPPDKAFRTSGLIEDPTPLETLVQLLLDWLLSETPTASAELAALKADRNGSLARDRARVRQLAEDRLTEFLSDPPDPTKSLRAAREDQLRAALRKEAGEASSFKTLRAPSDRAAATTLLAPRGRFGTLIRWVQLFVRSRQSLLQELVAAGRSWGREPLMLVPLMVDYAHWLGQTTRSSPQDQVAVFGEIARRSAVPVHGMVAYDPLRAVFWKLGKHDRFGANSEFDPLALCETALTEQGFLGLKLYPPMGFQATGNPRDDAAYPAAAVKALNAKGRLGVELDRAMARAFDFCLRHDAPMIAHANNSVAAGPGYGHRAEPRFWIDALRDRPGLRLCLAHQGSFCWKASTPAGTTPPDRTSWEWTIGTYIRDNPGAHLYMDISYFSELLGTAGQADYIAGQLIGWIRDCDPEVRHILFGTDWVMLGQEPGFQTYGSTVLAFLRDRCHLTQAQVERVMWQNAMRYLGLDRGKTRKRLLDFYGTRRPAWTRIPRFRMS